MKLFNEYEARTDGEDGGAALGRLIENAIRPIIHDWIVSGASTRDVEAIAMEEVAGICAELRIRRALARHDRAESLPDKAPTAT